MKKLFEKYLCKTRQTLRVLTSVFARKYPVYIFHHLPKCGGTSVNKVLTSWFLTHEDYRKGENNVYPDKVDLQLLRSTHCLCGHFELNGYFLKQRYPDVFSSGLSKYRVFTFIRDPLQLQLSLYRYEKKYKKNGDISIEEHLTLRPNYLASIFPARIDNYKEVIDGYYFIGILEDAQKSIDMLARMLKKNTQLLPVLNETMSTINRETESIDLPLSIINKFKKDNELDYLIYDYCIERYNKMLANSKLCH